MSIPLNLTIKTLHSMKQKIYPKGFDFDAFRKKFNAFYKLELNAKFVGLSGLVSRIGDFSFALFVRSFLRAFDNQNSLLSRFGLQTFRVSGYKIRVRLW